MPSIANTLVWAVAASSLAVATPVTPKVGTFTLDQVKTVKTSHVKRSGPAALAKAYLKYGKPVPAALQAAIANITATNELARRDGSATTTPEDEDSEYLTPVKIGTPAVTVNLDFDTGSSDLWVFSSDLSASLRAGHGVYSPSSSSTGSKISGASWSISYGDGSSASGSVYTDVVNIGGVSFAKQAVEAASKISSAFTQDTNNDGLVGLAFSSINTVKPTKQKTFFDNVKGSLTKPIIGVNLKAGAPGSYDFGFADTSAFTGSVAYTNVDSSQGFWSFTTTGGYKVGTTSFSTSLTGIADTGTTLLLLPDTVVNNYYKQVSGAKNSASIGGWVFPCSATLPNFSFNVGSNTIVVPGKYINWASVSTGSSSCYGGIQSSSDIGINIFGDIALKAAYVVFDSSSTPRLGWASKST